MNRREHFRQPLRGAFGETIQPGARRHFVSPILSALGVDLGGVVASVAAPALTGAAVGAGTAAITGGNVGMGALYGGIGGGALGYMTSGSGTGGPGGQTGLYNDASGALSGMFGSGGGGGAGAVGAGIPQAGGDTGWVPTSGPGGAAPQGSDTGWFAPTDTPGTLPTSTTGQAANVAGGGGGLFGGQPGGIGGTALTLGAMSALGSMFNKPQIGKWATPGPSSTAANAGPYFNAPLNTAVPGRTPVAPAQGTDWYTYGQRPEQNFFSGNSLKNYGWAKGGALNGVFDTARGENHVRGPGTATSDSVPARLSNGEYVWTKADVDRWGGGDNELGAKKLDQLRTEMARNYGEKKFVRQPLRGALGHRMERAA